MTEASRKVPLNADELAVQRAWAAEIERRSLIAAQERGTDWRIALEEIRADILGL